jgi:hypothetical protein
MDRKYIPLLTAFNIQANHRRSVLLINVASKYPALLDATVITGFAPYAPAFRAAFAGFGMTIAKEDNPSRFGKLNRIILISRKSNDVSIGNLPTSYWTAADIVANQQVFFRYPSFDPGSVR